ncbi:MAG: flavin-containing monooxygenase, partial [Pseudomonadales bacterium]
YASHVADELDLRRHIQFGTSVAQAGFDAASRRGQVTPDTGTTADTRDLIMATGRLSAANTPDVAGVPDFTGATYHTGAWPHEGVDFSGKRVAVIGTGSSGIQSIPLIAEQAASLTVFQRTANYSVPAQNRPMDPDYAAQVKADYADFRYRNKQQMPAFGANYPRRADSVLEATPEERQARFEEYWQHGGFIFGTAFGDLGASLEANEYAAEFVRGKIRDIVQDPATAEKLCPTTVFGCKRLCADTGYFATYNQPHVSLIDVNEQPIQKLTAEGIVAGDTEHGFDAIVFATGFDAMTGSLLRCDIRGVGGQTLGEKWIAGPRTYLGLMTAGFPNLFTMTGPGSPSVLANMITAGEQHAEFISELIDWNAQRKVTRIDADLAAEDEWVEVVNLRAQQTFYPHCNSWYLGANVPGKPRVFMPYLGFPAYSEKLAEVVDAGYEGFVTSKG